MDELKAVVRSAIVIDDHWEMALQQALAQTRDIVADLVVLFAHNAYAEHFPELVRRVRQETGAGVLIGCSGQGIIGTGQEIEDVPALSLLVLSLPGAVLKSAHFTQQMVETCAHPQAWRDQLDIPLDDVNAWLVFADPFHMDCERWLDGLARAYIDLPMLGGMASGDTEERRTYVFLNDEVFDEGAVGLALGGSYTILPLVSQGCEPIGEPWTITGVHDNGLIRTISNRPAYDLLVDTFQCLSLDVQFRAQRNLLVGLAADEYRDSFGRGSFLIRPLLGVDRRQGAIAIGALPRVGQTIQFQMRDAATADLDLRELLEQTNARLGTNRPIAGVLCTCNGRGTSMFGLPHHDANIVAEELGELPLTGLFCNGEIGPVGKRPFLHGFTASLAFLIQRH